MLFRSTNLEKKIKYEKIGLSSLELLKARVVFTSELKSLCECSIIIDAMIENYDVKKEVYKSLATLCPGCIIASTTSSLDLQKLATYYDPKIFLGLHFFNPPTKMKLIELSYLPETTVQTKEIINKLLRRFDDKQVIEMPVLQGYIVNRLLFLYINAAFRMIEKYSVNYCTVDNAMKFGANMPMGPCELSDYIGNDITLDILNQFYNAFNDEAYAPSSIIVAKVKAGELGRKTKNGFYRY